MNSLSGSTSTPLIVQHDNDITDLRQTVEQIQANPTQPMEIVHDATTLLKYDLSLPSQAGFGQVLLCYANTNLLNGQPVRLSTMSDNTLGAFHLYANDINHIRVAHGIALDTVAALEKVRVCVDGYATVRYTNNGNENLPTDILWGPASAMTPHPLTDNSKIRFLDTGGSSNYGSNELYEYTFDAGEGYTVSLDFNTFEFESGTYSHYDRLGIQVSDTDIDSDFTNASIPWCAQTAVTSPPYGNSYSSSQNGWIVPATTTRALQNGATSFPGEVWNSGRRYVRFHFYSDSSSNRPGWDIIVSRTNYTYPPPLPNIHEPLYANMTDLHDVVSDTQSSTGDHVTVGYVASPNNTNNAILARVRSSFN